MTETLKDMMAARADAAPGPDIDIAGLIHTGRRRVWRHRAIGGTAAGAVLAVVGLIAPSVLPGGGDGDPSFSDGLGERQISYASGSTIHYGDESIDVAPHQLASYVVTDDGFVYAAADGDVYFTDGDGSTRIGHAGGDNRLVADDSGSYVGWVETDPGSGTEVVVYDTAVGGEVFRSPKDDGSGSGCYTAIPGLALRAIDGDTAYICGADGTSAWDLPSRTQQWVTPPRPGSVQLADVADGYLAWALPDWDRTGTIVSPHEDADRPFYGQVTASSLSPDSRYIAGIQLTGDSWRSLLFDRTTEREVELAMPEYREWYVLQWVDDDRFTAVGYDAEDYEGAAADAPDLLTCDASSASCTVVGQASGSYIIHPDGQSYWR
jgi:hypothetical protein